MKKLIIFFAVACCYSGTSYATVWTVNNNSDGRAQYTDVAATIDTGSDGKDVELLFDVAPSRNNWNKIGINRLPYNSSLNRSSISIASSKLVESTAHAKSAN